MKPAQKRNAVGDWLDGLVSMSVLDCVFVDTSGLGMVIADKLESIGIPITRINRAEARQLRKSQSGGQYETLQSPKHDEL
jgi:hypothetical protein